MPSGEGKVLPNSPPPLYTRPSLRSLRWRSRGGRGRMLCKQRGERCLAAMGPLSEIMCVFIGATTFFIDLFFYYFAQCKSVNTMH